MRRALEGLGGVRAVEAAGDAFDLLLDRAGPVPDEVERAVAAIVVLPGVRRVLARHLGRRPTP